MLDRLPADVRQELSDRQFVGRQHHTRGTYAIGCRGPLCRKAERDRGRVRSEEKAASKSKVYTPNFGTRLEEDELLDEIVIWYKGLRKKAS